MEASSLTRLVSVAIAALTLCLSEAVYAQSAKVDRSISKKDTVPVFGSRLKITIAEGTFEKMTAGVSARKYAGLFNLHDVVASNGFVLRATDTLIFYITSIDRPAQSDGGISTWELINSFLDHTPAYRLESGWNTLGHDYRYSVRLILRAKPNQVFEFDFFFIENKLAFSVLQRPIEEPNFIEQQSYTVVSTR